MKTIEATKTKNRADSALLKLAALQGGGGMSESNRFSRIKPRRGGKPKPGSSDPRGSRVKGGLHHA
jgi:hypothetical protein